MVEAAPRETVAFELEQLADAPSLGDVLPELRMPVVARVGTLDLATPREKSEVIANACPRGQLELVPDAGHALVFEDVAGTAESIARLLQLT